MKVFFTCTTTKFKQYKNNYRAIRNFLVKEGHIITRDWIQKVHLNSKEFEDEENGSVKIYKLTRKALDEADILIVEDTVESFSNGHLITVALQRRIPVLVLWHTSKKRYFSKSLIQGMEDPLLQISKYTMANYKNIIRAFLNKYANANEKHHFHLVINEAERRFVDWACFNKNRSRTEVIREALRKMMESDKKYLQYLQD